MSTALSVGRMTIRSVMSQVASFSGDELDGLSAALGMASLWAVPLTGTGVLGECWPEFEPASPALLYIGSNALGNLDPTDQFWAAGWRELGGVDDYAALRDLDMNQVVRPGTGLPVPVVRSPGELLADFVEASLDEAVWLYRPGFEPGGQLYEDSATLQVVAGRLSGWQREAVLAGAQELGPPWLFVHRASCRPGAAPPQLPVLVVLQLPGLAWPAELLAAYEPWCELVQAQALVKEWERQDGRELTADERAERLWRAFGP